jgi:hypothetical protein
MTDDRFDFVVGLFGGGVLEGVEHRAKRRPTQRPAPRPASGPGRRLVGLRQLRGRPGLGELGLHLCQLGIDPTVVAELRELAIDVILAAAGLRDVPERTRLLELAHRVGASLHVLGLLDRALRCLTDVGHLVADARGRLRHLHLGLSS